jgi:hypothetical protein
MDVKELFLEYLCPLAGTFTAVFMFLAPFSDLQKCAMVHHNLSTLSLNPLPWAFMMGNCLGWVVYSVLKDNLVRLVPMGV